MDNPKVIIDINTLLEKYKTGKLLKDCENFEKDFGIKIIPVDVSKQNTMSPTPTMKLPYLISR